MSDPIILDWGKFWLTQRSFEGIKNKNKIVVLINLSPKIYKFTEKKIQIKDE